MIWRRHIWYRHGDLLDDPSWRYWMGIEDSGGIIVVVDYVVAIFRLFLKSPVARYCNNFARSAKFAEGKNLPAASRDLAFFSSARSSTNASEYPQNCNPRQVDNNNSPANLQFENREKSDHGASFLQQDLQGPKKT